MAAQNSVSEKLEECQLLFWLSQALKALLYIERKSIHTLLCGLTINSIVQNFGFFFQRHKLENLKQMLTRGICFRM